MKLDRFINRPVLSTVISIVIVILGILGLFSLPISQYIVRVLLRSRRFSWPDSIMPTKNCPSAFCGISLVYTSRSGQIPVSFWAMAERKLASVTPDHHPLPGFPGVWHIPPGGQPPQNAGCAGCPGCPGQIVAGILCPQAAPASPGQQRSRRHNPRCSAPWSGRFRPRWSGIIHR